MCFVNCWLSPHHFPEKKQQQKRTKFQCFTESKTEKCTESCLQLFWVAARSTETGAATKLQLQNSCGKAYTSAHFSTIAFFFVFLHYYLRSGSRDREVLPGTAWFKTWVLGNESRVCFLRAGMAKQHWSSLSKIQSLSRWAPNRKTRVAALLEGRI